MGLYNEIAAQVTSALQSYGMVGTLNQYPVSQSSTTYTPSTSTNTPGAPVAHAVNCAVFSFPPGDQFFNGVAIVQDDKKVIMEAISGVVPSLRDTFTVGGITYSIISILQSNPAGTPVAYTLHIRK